MAQHTEVALHGGVHGVEVDQARLVLLGDIPHTRLHFLDALLCRLTVAREDPAAHEGDPVLYEPDRGLSVKFEVQHIVEVLLDLHPPLVQHCGVRVQQRHVVHVTLIKVRFQFVLDVLIQFIKTDVREQLAGKVSDRHTHLKEPLRRWHLVGCLSRRKPEGRVVAVDDRLHEPEKAVLVRVFAPQNTE